MIMLRKVFCHSLPALLSFAAEAATYHLTIEEKPVNFSGQPAKAIAINQQIPGPELRFQEGEHVVIKVTNRLKEETSLHWHGLITPYQMDGVPGISFNGIKPGETFTYRFPLKQNGTYWYHSHSGLQEQSGVYGSLIIEPKKKDPFEFDRDYTVLLSDWTNEDPNQVFKNLKSDGDYYKKGETAKGGYQPDLSDVTGYTFLMNGTPPVKNWQALFKPGEKVRLRLINAASSTYFDFRIPGLTMTVVQKDGQNITPVKVEQIHIANAETFDVIVEPLANAYTLFAEAVDRTGYARGTLTTDTALTVIVPEIVPELDSVKKAEIAKMKPFQNQGVTNTSGPQVKPVKRRVLHYSDIRALNSTASEGELQELTVNLTGEMDSYSWSFNHKTYDMAKPIEFEFGKRVRVRLVNRTMMAHPIHLHGLWQKLQNGYEKEGHAPRMHTVNVPPMSERVVEIDADNPGRWAFHCHLLYHARAGMFREIQVRESSTE
ncbi:hypothetical protein ACH42_00005 [Endozoicomonas sp. (ex Bugula neritina AB1)]|nr:hypothetical protein ACH42_00005 [Endozoicomonas sp. (ex Bugula neritina AB1)]